MFVKRKILFIGLVWPEPTSSAAGWRIINLVKSFINIEANEVYFASCASKTAYSYDLSTLNVEEHFIKLNDASFDEFVTKLSPDIVFFDRYMIEEQYGWRVAACCPNALRILDTEDLHFLRHARQEAYKNKNEINLQSTIAIREIASILRSDISLIISQKEIKLLIEIFNVDKDRLFYLPFQEDALEDNHINSLLNHEERKDFVFIGNFIHEPNWKTVEKLKKEIWPTLRKILPEASLHIYGAYASQKVLQLNNEKERFIIKGRAEDARKTIEKYKVLIAPIPFGAGTKGKFIDAMYSGTPTITTTIGAEDMTCEGKWCGFIEDNDEAFINKAKELYEDQNNWQNFQTIGFEIFNHTVANNKYTEDFLQVINSYLRDLEYVRSKNFIGKILMHNQNHATKYMALWIEEKNKEK